MLRRNTILTTAALMAVFAAPAAAQTSDDMRSPDAKDAAAHRGLYESDGKQHAPEGSYGSPGPYPDSERKLVESPEVQGSIRGIRREIRETPGYGSPGPYPDSERKLVESPEVQGSIRGIRREIRETPAVIQVHGPSEGFDWGDAGIGAAGMLALFSIAAGSALMLGGRRRRRGVGVAAH